MPTVKYRAATSTENNTCDDREHRMKNQQLSGIDLILGRDVGIIVQVVLYTCCNKSTFPLFNVSGRGLPFVAYYALIISDSEEHTLSVAKGQCSH